MCLGFSDLASFLPTRSCEINFHFNIIHIYKSDIKVSRVHNLGNNRYVGAVGMRTKDLEVEISCAQI